jgi:hypothetical protein
VDRSGPATLDTKCPSSRRCDHLGTEDKGRCVAIDRLPGWCLGQSNVAKLGFIISLCWHAALYKAGCLVIYMQPEIGVAENACDGPCEMGAREFLDFAGCCVNRQSAGCS